MTQGCRYRTVFFGTPAFAVPSLQTLLDGPDQVVGVVCRPDRPAGRGRRVQAPPVKQLARSHEIPIVQPEKVRTPEFFAVLERWMPDLVIVAAYGRILPVAVLDLPPRGCINVHASLLPKYRGAAPIQWAIRRGETVTGVTVMQMNERMDAGDILLQRELAIGAQETYGELQERLAGFGAAVLADALERMKAGKLDRVPQDHAAATPAPMVKKDDGLIDWSRPAGELALQVRAFNPWPSAFTRLDSRLLKIYRARVSDATSPEPPGVVLAAGETLDVAAGSGILRIEELQIEGRRRLPASAFARGGPVRVGVRLGGD